MKIPGSSIPFIENTQRLSFPYHSPSQTTADNVELTTNEYTIPPNRYGILHIPKFSIENIALVMNDPDGRVTIVEGADTRVIQRFSGELFIKEGYKVWISRTNDELTVDAGRAAHNFFINLQNPSSDIFATQFIRATTKFTRSTGSGGTYTYRRLSLILSLHKMDGLSL